MSFPFTPIKPAYIPPQSPAPSPMHGKRKLLEEATLQPSVHDFFKIVIDDLVERNKVIPPVTIHFPRVLRKVQKECIRQNLQDVFAWMLSSKHPITHAAFTATARKGDLLTFNLLMQQSSVEALTPKAAYQAALHDRFEFLKGAALPKNAAVCSAAVHNLAMLQWLRQNKCPWDANTVAEAAAGGHVFALKWALENHCPYDNKALAWGVHYQQEVSIKVLLANNVTWSDESLLLAAEQGNTDGIALARSLNCPWSLKVAVMAKDTVTLEWLKAQRCPLTKEVAYQAASTSNLANLDWALKNTPTDSKIYEIAAEKGHLETLKRICEHGVAGFKPRDIKKVAQDFGHHAIVDWIDLMKAQFGKRKASSHAHSDKKRKENPKI